MNLNMRYIVLGLFFLTIHLTFALKIRPVIVDSELTLKQALKGVDSNCPKWIIKNQALIEVYYYGFDNAIHKGQVVADCRLARDLHFVFKIAFDNKFPFSKVLPISEYGWDDFASMRANNSSAFNYRVVPFSKNLSKHAYGWAIDINPVENPYYTKGKVFPKGATYNIKKRGTLFARHAVVKAFKSLGWRWGGDWISKDYQHFDKRLKSVIARYNKKVYIWPWKIK